MKAISLWEPWASLVRTGAKKIETRGWLTIYRGELLICAAKRKRIYELIHLLSCWPFQGGLAPLVGKPLDMTFKTWAGVEIEDLNFGKAVAVVNLYDCVPVEDLSLGEVMPERHFGDFSPGRYGWKMELIEAIEPFEVTGSQGYFSVPWEFDEESRLMVPA
jgi:activating signal cointegrator 1